MAFSGYLFAVEDLQENRVRFFGGVNQTLIEDGLSVLTNQRTIVARNIRNRNGRMVVHEGRRGRPFRRAAVVRRDFRNWNLLVNEGSDAIFCGSDDRLLLQTDCFSENHRSPVPNPIWVDSNNQLTLIGATGGGTLLGNAATRPGGFVESLCGSISNGNFEGDNCNLPPSVDFPFEQTWLTVSGTPDDQILVGSTLDASFAARAAYLLSPSRISGFIGASGGGIASTVAISSSGNYWIGFKDSIGIGFALVSPSGQTLGENYIPDAVVIYTATPDGVIYKSENGGCIVASINESGSLVRSPEFGADSGCNGGAFVINRGGQHVFHVKRLDRRGRLRNAVVFAN